MEELIEKLSVINVNFWTLRYEEQLLLLNMYKSYTLSSKFYRGKVETLENYSNNIETILSFKDEYSKLNSTGRKFIRTNINNKFNSEGYRNSLDGEKYGCYNKYVLDKFKDKHIKIELDYEIIKYYLLIFIVLPDIVQYELVYGFICELRDVHHSFKNFGYPVKMQDDFNYEMYDLLRDNYDEYEKMTPDKRMEFIKYLVDNQIPRALTYMSETKTRRQLIKMGRNEENVKKLSLHK